MFDIDVLFNRRQETCFINKKLFLKKSLAFIRSFIHYNINYIRNLIFSSNIFFK